jgi:hypothetical protein
MNLKILTTGVSMYKKAVFSIFIMFLFINPTLAVNKTPVKKYGEVRPDKALVYFIRPNNFMASARTEFIYSDDSFATALDNHTYSFAYLDPGEHLIWMNWTSIQKKMIFEAGHTYYFQIFDQIIHLSEEQGKSMIISAANFATPTEKEIKKTASHIKNRFKRATKKMNKDEYAEVNQQTNTYLSPHKRPGAVMLPANTPIKVRLLENVTSVFTEVGGKVYFETAEDIYDKNKLLIAKDTPCEATLWHKSDGKAGGIAGSFELLVSSVTAADGNQIPVLGQIASALGSDRTDKVMLTGLMGLLSTKSRQSFMFSATDFTVKTKDDAWIIPVQTNKNISAGRLSTIPTENTFNALINTLIKFQPHKKSKPKDITVELDKKFKWDELTLIGVNGTAIPESVKSKNKVSSKESQSFVFDGWSVVRFLPIGTGQNKFDLNFTAASGGHDFPAVAAATLDLKAK